MATYIDNNDNMKQLKVSTPTNKDTCVIKALGYGSNIAISLSKSDVLDMVNKLINDFDLKINGDK